MKVEIEPYRCLPCSLQHFEINGVRAFLCDFGDTTIGGDCMDNSCHCSFSMKLPTDEVLERYGITLKEYGEVCEELKEKLYVGACGWCS